jgi:hypothetical protein
MLKSRSFAFFSVPLLAGLFAGATASASTMTFSGLPLPPTTPLTTYSENGITATGNSFIDAFGMPQSAHLDDGGTGLASMIAFTLSGGGLFNTVSFDLSSAGFNYHVCPDNTLQNCITQTYANVQLTGYRNGSLVASTLFDMSLSNGLISPGSLFRNLDTFIIGFGPFPFEGTLANGNVAECTDTPCSHYDIDNVTLSAVPLPAAGGLMLAALAGIAATTRRRSARRAQV